MENDKITVKVLVKWSYVFDVVNYTAIRDGSVMGQAIESPSFVVGGCPFTILFYPHGRNEAAHSRGEVSLFIRNESPKEVESAHRHDRDILISDIRYDVFEAVLWFTYNHNLDIYDTEAIRKSNPSEPDSYASRMLAAADRFDMKHFRRQCESIISEEHGLFYQIKTSFEKLLGDALSLLDSSKNSKIA